MHTIAQTRLREAANELRAIADGELPRTDVITPTAAARPLERPLEQYERMLHSDGPLAAAWRSRPDLVVGELLAALRFYMDLQPAPAPAVTD